MPSCQNIPTKLKFGGWLKCARGNFCPGVKEFQKVFKPIDKSPNPRYDNPRVNNNRPAKIRINP